MMRKVAEWGCCSIRARWSLYNSGLLRPLPNHFGHDLVHIERWLSV